MKLQDCRGVPDILFSALCNSKRLGAHKRRGVPDVPETAFTMGPDVVRELGGGYQSLFLQ